MIRRMASVEILGPLELFSETVATIQEAGLMHLEEVPLFSEGDSVKLHRIHLPEDKQREREDLEEVAKLLEDGVALIPAEGRKRLEAELRDEYGRWEREPLDALRSSARVLHARVRSLVRRERNLADDLRVLAVYEEVAAALAPLIETHELPSEFEFVGLVIEKKNRLAVPLLHREVNRLTSGDYRFFDRLLASGGSAVLVGLPRSSSKEVRAFMADAGLSEMSFPRYLRNRAFEDALATLEHDIGALRQKRSALAEQGRRFFEEYGARLVAMHQLLSDQIARYDAMPSFARTDYTFVIWGWVPAGELAPFSSSLREKLGDSLVVRPVMPRSMGKPPVALQNRAVTRSFEPLLSLLPKPRYGTIDPTGFVATFFPPMFGLMLADIGYGAILAVLAVTLLLRGRKKKGSLTGRLGVVAAFLAGYTIAFGVLFGELFGNFGHSIGLHPLWRERFSLEGEHVGELLLGYLAIAIGMGVLHVLLGLVLGIVNASRLRDRHAAAASLSRIVGIFVLFFAVGRLVNLLPPVFTSFAVIALVIGIVLMVYQAIHNPAHGLLLPLEILGTVGNILSYARIMAIGVASAVLALLANMFGNMIANVVLAAIIVILVHSLNLVLGIVDPTVQGLRLHYVEFFSKFYQGGGRKFTPFRKLGGQFV